VEAIFVANKNKGGREARKPKKDKKVKAALPTPSAAIPPSAHAADKPHK
jgi:hypothetical protein